MKKIKRSSGVPNRIIHAVSGGADSVYLLERSVDRRKRSGISPENLLVAHVNHGARGRESDEDMRFVENLAKGKALEVRVKRAPNKGAGGMAAPGFEERARNLRYAYLKELQAATGAKKILLAHNADDQVETVLMRILEGAGISGLKGIPRTTADGIERPLLDTWREEIVEYLDKHKIPYRVDKSNFDTRFERNWVRHALIPMLEKRYGKSVKKRIFALGERFREIDEFLEATARGWMKRNVKDAERGIQFPRKPFGKLPSAIRMKVLQIICFERVGISPNERLLESMDRLILNGGASARLSIGKGAALRCRYHRVNLEVSGMGTSKERGRSPTLQLRGPGKYELNGRGEIRLESGKGIPASGLKRLTKGERTAVFDRGELVLPLSLRPLRAGDRIRPFGLDAEKKIKEILIDRKVPREERWGRAVVCDAKGAILWVPGLVRSVHAPVAPATRRTVILRFLQTSAKPA